MPTEPTEKTGWFARLRAGVEWLNANKKRFFWYWVAYQAVKGMITLSLVWVPLLIFWLRTRNEG